jgi:hypothetical protein
MELRVTEGRRSQIPQRISPGAYRVDGFDTKGNKEEGYDEDEFSIETSTEAIPPMLSAELVLVDENTELSLVSENTELFEVEVPHGVQPGQPFGLRMLVTCPPNAHPGQRIRFKLSPALLNATNDAAKIKLMYGKDGWTRTVRVTDMKFQWVRTDDKVRSWIINVSLAPFFLLTDTFLLSRVTLT